MNPSPLRAVLVLAALLGPGFGMARAQSAPDPCCTGSWPAFKGDNAREGRGLALRLPISRVWSVQLKGSLYSSPVIQDGRVFLASSAKRVYCVDLADGAVLWQTALPDRVWGSSPALAGGRLYVGCVDGCVYALDLADGAVRGAYCAGGARGWSGGSDVLSSPLVADGRLVFGSDDHTIYGKSLSGGPDWSVATGDKLHDNGAAERDGLVVMASRDSMVRALSLADGNPRWTFKAGCAFNTVPAMDARRAYLGGADGRLYALSLADGSPAWSYPTGRGVMSSPALGVDGSVVFGSADGSVYCLDAAGGALRWAFRTGGYVLSSPLITGSLVWIGSYDGRLYVLALADGHELWSMGLAGGVYASPATVGDRVLVAGRDGALVCLKAVLP